MVVSFQVLSVESTEMSPSILLSTESKRVLFNVGDGTQRLCMEHHVRLTKLQHVFLTELRARALGGLPGMILTVSDTGKPGLAVHGPVGTQQYVHATRHFLMRPQFQLDVKEVEAIEEEEKKKKKKEKGVHAFQQHLCMSDEEIAVYGAETTASVRGCCGKRRVDGSMASDASNRDAASDIASPSVSYVVETAHQRGKFLVEKALELGVPKGKLFGQLHRGEDVTLPDGRVVRSADCVAPPIPASGAAVIACPSVAHLESLVNHPLFLRYQLGTCEGSAELKKDAAVELQVMFHLAGPEIVSHSSYQAWAKRFGPNVNHILLNHPNTPGKTVYRASALLQAQLHTVFPHVFPSNAYEMQDMSLKAVRDTSQNTMGKGVTFGEPMLKYTIFPIQRRGFDKSACFQELNREEIARSVESFSKETNPTDQLDEAVSSHEQKVPDVRGKIIFLGTGCAIPSKYRNVTGMYLQVDIHKNGHAVHHGIMLDCGEGSCGQLFRYVNGDVKQFHAMIEQLRCVWISHNHADHHLGLLRILSTRKEATTTPLLVIAPTPVRYWLDEYSAVDPTIQNSYRFVDNRCFNEADRNKNDDTATRASTLKYLSDELNISSFETVPVKHAHLSYAVVLTLLDGKKVAFSGDCRPSDRFAHAARNALLMIHEATFEDSMTDEAKQKCHCTTAEAINVGRAAKTQHVVLTHFSQRYPKMPVLDRTEDVLTAFDLMSLTLDALRQPRLMDVCTRLMAMDEEDRAQDTDSTSPPTVTRF